MMLAAHEFIRGFLLHVLPRNFYRIRYYGILSSRQRKTKLAKCRELLKAEHAQLSEEASPGDDEAAELLRDEARRCPKCQKGHLIRHKIPRLSPARMIVSDAGPP